MSNYSSLKSAIDANIKANGRREITGPVLNAILNAVVNSLGDGYLFRGVAIPSTNPGTPDQNVAYLAITEGTYTHMGGLSVTDGELSVFSYNGAWSKIPLALVPTKTSQLDNDLRFVTSEEMGESLSSKQDTIQDLSEIRSGAALGSTAYQKPSAGIPASDMTTAVQNSLELANSSVQAEPIGSIIPPVNPSEFATKEEVSQLRSDVNENDKEINGRVSDLRFIVGGDTEIELTPLDYTGMRAGENSISLANETFDSFMIKVEMDVEYNISQSPISVVASQNPFYIGGERGTFVHFPYTPTRDGYILITVRKSDGNFVVSKPISGVAKTSGDAKELAERNATSIEGEYYTKRSAPSYGRCSKGIALPFRGKTRVTVSVVSGTDTDKYSIFRYTNGAMGTALAQNVSFGDSAVVTIPEGDDGIWLFTIATNISSARTYGVKFDEFDWSIKSKLDVIAGEVSEFHDFALPIISESVTNNNGDRISKSYYVGHAGEEILFNCSLLSGTDSGRWKLFGTSADGSSIDAQTTVVDYTALGNAKKFIAPSNGYVWLFTETVVSATTTYGIEAELSNNINVRMDEAEGKIDAIYSQINAVITDVDTTEGSGERISQAIFLGNPGRTAKINVTVLSGTDTERWKLFGTNDGATALDANTTVVDYSKYNDPKEFVIPANGYVWLFTESVPSTTRTYNVFVSLMSSLENRVTALEEAQAKPLEGKVMVCFGDSITEFKGTDGKRYSDWLEEITGATIINVGIGGTQIRQRATPSATPSGDNQCYAGLDMVNLVKSAMEQDFTIARASAQELARISADDNTAIVERLASIDWSTVDYVTIMGGANDWRGNVGSTGDADSTSISETCGAMNNIISQICSTYKGIKLYWLTTIVQYVDPATFSVETSYNVGDLCSYSGAYYRFVNAHQGAWDANDVEQITRADCRIPELFSDNKVLYGKNLREFCSLLESVAVKNHIPVINLYDKLGWNSYNFANFFPNYDNTHPYTGFKWLAEKIAKFILSN